MKRAVLAGWLATLLMSVVALMAPAMGMPKMDFGDMLGTQNPLMPMPYAMGWVMHFIAGGVFGVIYVSFARDQLPGANWLKGLLFGLILFAIAQSVVMPMMGNGFWSMGQGGLLMGSLIGHIVFGVVLGLAAPSAASTSPAESTA